MRQSASDYETPEAVTLVRVVRLYYEFEHLHSFQNGNVPHHSMGSCSSTDPSAPKR